MKLSIVIPAYNEEKRLPRTLEEIDAYLRRQPYSYEIIVVNDGSKDGTAALVRGLLPVISHLRLIDNKENFGKGYVVRQGLLSATGEYRLFMDADNSTTIDHVEKMWPEFEKGFDVVIASRDVEGARLEPAQPFLRRCLGKLFVLVVKIVLGLWGVWDTQCGFKAFRAGVVQEVFPNARVNRFAFDPEILLLARRSGYKIKEIPVVWKNDVESRVKPSWAVKMLFEVLQVRWNLMTGKYTQKSQ